MKFGLIPEFIGRVPVNVSLNPLDKEALVRILTEPKSALVKQYQKLLMDGVELKFTELGNRRKGIKKYRSQRTAFYHGICCDGFNGMIW